MPNDAGNGRALTWLALLLAAITVGGSLGLTLNMGLYACPLCFYQRTFAIGVLGVLGVGLLAGAARGPMLSLLSLPLAVAGLVIAVFHVSLELKGKLECPDGVLGLGTAPKQSLVALGLLTAVLAIDVGRAVFRPPSPSPLPPGGEGRVRGAENKPHLRGLLAAVAVGVLFAWGCIQTAASPCKTDPKSYDSPPTMCRKPRQ